MRDSAAQSLMKTGCDPASCVALEKVSRLCRLCGSRVDTVMWWEVRDDTTENGEVRLAFDADNQRLQD
jgi:hypothetical protein